jgi:hypothetical protein
MIILSFSFDLKYLPLFIYGSLKVSFHELINFLNIDNTLFNRFLIITFKFFDQKFR